MKLTRATARMGVPFGLNNLYCRERLLVRPRKVIAPQTMRKCRNSWISGSKSTRKLRRASVSTTTEGRGRPSTMPVLSKTRSQLKVSGYLPMYLASPPLLPAAWRVSYSMVTWRV